MPKINQEEYEILKELDDKWKWMVRDRNTVLWAYELKPTRYEITFVTWDDLSSDFEMVDGNFQFIKWEDEEPYSIAELIEEYEKDYKGSWEHAIEFSKEMRRESEETEVKKDKEVLVKYLEKEISNFKPGQMIYDYLTFILKQLNQLDEPEVLSQEWIDEHSNGASRSQYVWVDDLKGLLVPKQEEVDQAYKDGYEKGKQHATEKQSEETETVAGVLVDYLIASAKLKLALRMEVEEAEE